MNARACDVRRAQASAMAWLESLAHAIEDGRLMPSPVMPDADRAELREQLAALRGVVLPDLHQTFGTMPGARVVDGAK